MKAKVTLAKVEMIEKRERNNKIASLVSIYKDWMKGFHTKVDEKMADEISSLNKRSQVLEKQLSKARKSHDELHSTLAKVFVWLMRP